MIVARIMQMKRKRTGISWPVKASLAERINSKRHEQSQQSPVGRKARLRGQSPEKLSVSTQAQGFYQRVQIRSRVVVGGGQTILYILTSVCMVWYDADSVTHPPGVQYSGGITFPPGEVTEPCQARGTQCIHRDDRGPGA